MALVGREGFAICQGGQGGASHADTWGQEYDKGGVWVLSQVAAVKLRALASHQGGGGDYEEPPLALLA